MLPELAGFFAASSLSECIKAHSIKGSRTLHRWCPHTSVCTPQTATSLLSKRCLFTVINSLAKLLRYRGIHHKACICVSLHMFSGSCIVNMRPSGICVKFLRDTDSVTMCTKLCSLWIIVMAVTVTQAGMLPSSIVNGWDRVSVGNWTIHFHAKVLVLWPFSFQFACNNYFVQ